MLAGGVDAGMALGPPNAGMEAATPKADVNVAVNVPTPNEKVAGDPEPAAGTGAGMLKGGAGAGGCPKLPRLGAPKVLAICWRGTPLNPACACVQEERLRSGTVHNEGNSARVMCWPSAASPWAGSGAAAGSWLGPCCLLPMRARKLGKYEPPQHRCFMHVVRATGEGRVMFPCMPACALVKEVGVRTCAQLQRSLCV